jgi:hypothetical protein
MKHLFKKILGLQKLGPQIENPHLAKNDWVCKSQIQKFPHIGGKSASLENFFVSKFADL